MHHLCASGVGTFSITPQGSTGDDVAYALKVVSEPLSDAGRRETAFEALLGIDHPHVVRYRATGTHLDTSGRYRWLAMDLVAGSTLEQVLSGGDVLDSATAVRLLREVVDGASALWAVGTVHGDLLPSNVMVTPAGRAVIVDLGVGREGDEPRRRAAGTAAQPRAIPALDDWRTDQLALGVLGCRVVTGADVALGHDGAEAGPAEVPRAVRPAHELDPAVPRDLSRVLARMLAPRPQDRYADPEVLRSDLARIADTLAPPTDVVFAARSHPPACRLDA